MIYRALSPAAILARLLRVNRGASADIAHISAPPESAGIALLAAQSTADLQRLERLPVSPARRTNDTLRIR